MPGAGATGPVLNTTHRLFWGYVELKESFGFRLMIAPPCWMMVAVAIVTIMHLFSKKGKDCKETAERSQIFKFYMDTHPKNCFRIEYRDPEEVAEWPLMLIACCHEST